MSRVSPSVAAAIVGAALSFAPRGAAAGDERLFVDAAEELGLRFEYFNGMTGRLLMPEIVGGGGAFLDFDRDGDLDVFLVQGKILEPEKSNAAALRPPDGPLGDRLFRNRLIETGKLGFVDVTAESGIDGDGYGMGSFASDYDGDGLVDLYVTNLGANHLWRNLGGGEFAESSAAAGVQDRRWSVPAVFFDYDRDGLVDLYVGNYVSYSVALDKKCVTAAGVADYCGPYSYEPAGDRLWRNLGDGTFRDVTVEAGLIKKAATLGALAADLDGNGWLDLYVANDGMANHMWLNQGDGTFRDDALLGGTALSGLGQPEAGMGVLAADFDHNGHLDLFLTHLDGETNTLYANAGESFFSDATLIFGLATASKAFTGFGTVAVDFDNDSLLDLVTVNGAVHVPDGASPDRVFPLEQRNHLYRHRAGEGERHTFEEVVSPPSSPFARRRVSRGLASGDVDNDGDVDLLVVNNSGPVELLLNRQDGRAAWVGIVFADPTAAVGALVSVEVEGRRIERHLSAGGSYASTSDPRLVIGLGRAAGAAPARVPVTVRWLDGESTRVELEVGRYSVVGRGS